MALPILWVLLTFMQASAADKNLGNRHGEHHMEHLETVVDHIAEWDEREGQASSILRLQSGLSLFAMHDDPRHESLRHGIKVQQDEKAPIFVQFDPKTKIIKTLYYSLSRTVETVEPGLGGRTTVTFMMAPSFYFVNGDRSGSQKMIALLQEAAKSHQAVLVVFHPSTLEILDVRYPGQ